MKEVLSDEQVHAVATLGLDRLVEPYMERFLVDLELSTTGDGPGAKPCTKPQLSLACAHPCAHIDSHV